MRVAMIGTGYVGLVSGACFADFGHVVTCIDKDPSKIERLEKGEIPIFEPGLDDLVARNVREGRLFFTLDGAQAIKDADAVFIAVGTPTRRGDGHADLSYVYAAAEEIAGLIDGFTVVVTKSTVPVGTGDEVEAIIKRNVFCSACAPIAPKETAADNNQGPIDLTPQKSSLQLQLLATVVAPGDPRWSLGVVRDLAKYYRIDPALRVARQAEWNQPVRWPLALIALGVGLFLTPDDRQRS